MKGAALLHEISDEWTRQRLLPTTSYCSSGDFLSYSIGGPIKHRWLLTAHPVVSNCQLYSTW